MKKNSNFTMFSELGKSSDSVCENEKLQIKTVSECDLITASKKNKSKTKSREFLNPLKSFGRRFFKRIKTSMGLSSVHSYEIQRRPIAALNNQQGKQPKSSSESNGATTTATKAKKTKVRVKVHNSLDGKTNPKVSKKKSVKSVVDSTSDEIAPCESTKYVKMARKSRNEDKHKRSSKTTTKTTPKRKRFRLRLPLAGKKLTSNPNPNDKGFTNRVAEKEHQREKKKKEQEKPPAREKQVVGICNVSFIYESNV